MNGSDYKKMSKVAGSELGKGHETRARHHAYDLQRVRRMKRAEKILVNLEKEEKMDVPLENVAK